MILLFIVIRIMVFQYNLSNTKEQGQKVLKMAYHLIVISPYLTEENAPLLGVESATSAKSFASRQAATSYSQIIGILYAILGGIAASETVLLTKAGVNILISSVLETYSPLSFLLLIALISTVVTQLYCLNKALQYELPIYIVPIFYTLYTCLAFVNTVVYLDAIEMQLFEILWLVFGILLIITGVWSLNIR
jgi:hypothetical protein